MRKKHTVSEPFFEFGPKAYLYGQALAALAIELGRLGEKYDVDIIIDPQAVDIRMLAESATDRVHIFAQHLDAVPVGKGMGVCLAEAVKAAGACGVMLNHAERKLSLPELAACIRRAKEAGLLTMVCGDSFEELRAIARLGPDMIVAEPSELIGTGKPADKAYVAGCIACIRAVDPGIMVLPAAGIRNGKDCYDIVRAGAGGTGSSSALATAKNPAAKAEEMIAAVRRAYNERVASK